MKLKDRRYPEIERRIGEMLAEDDHHDIGVCIFTDTFFVPSLTKEGYDSKEINYTLRGLIGKEYLEFYASQGDYSQLELTQKGRDEWVLKISLLAPEQIFVSFANSDQPLAKKIQKKILECDDKLSVFLGDHKSLTISKDFDKEIIANLKSSKFFISLRTDNYSKSYYCEQECGMALAWEKHIVSLIVSTDPKNYGFVDKKQGFFLNRQNLTKSCKNLVSKLRAL